MAPSSWQWANPNDYVFKILPDGVHTLILASATTWEQPKEQYEGDNFNTPPGSTSNLFSRDSDATFTNNFGMAMTKDGHHSSVDYSRKYIITFITSGN